MLTLSKPSDLSQAAARLRQSTGFSSESLNRDNSSQQKFHFQARSSTANSITANNSPQRANRVLVLQGRNDVRAVKIAGNGTSSTQLVQQMHIGGRWDFFSNGRFQFTPRGLGTFARTDLFPIVGSYNATNRGVSFSGSRSSSNLTSRNSASIAGNIFVQNGTIRASLNQRTISISAAVVNGTRFGSTIDRTVAVNMSMVRIG